MFWLPGDGSVVPSSPDHGSAGPSPCRQPAENIPLNPNGVTCPPSNKSLHFDPITSLAQMSQQLTSQAPPCQGPPFPSNNMMPMEQGMHIESMDSLPFVPQQGKSDQNDVSIKKIVLLIFNTIYYRIL